MKQLNVLEDGYNIATDPVCFMRGVKFSDDHRRKLGVISKARWADETYRQTISKAAKERMSHPAWKQAARQAAKRQWDSDEYRQKMSELLKGRKRSDETRAKISASKKGVPNLKARGRKMSDEAKAAISRKNTGRPSAFKGRTHTLETKLAIGNLHRGNKYCVGRVLSEDTKKKISMAHVGMRHQEATKTKRRLQPPRHGAFKGVTKNKRTGRYRASITNGATLFLGWFDDPIEAAENCDFYAIKIFGPDGHYLNFPNKTYDDYLPKRHVNIGKDANASEPPGG